MNSSHEKNILKNVIKIAVSVVLVVILYFNIDFDYVMHEIEIMPSWFLACVLLVTVAGMGIEVVKWRVLLKDVSVVPLIKAYLYGNFFTLALPGQLFGEAAKMATFGKYTNMYDRSIATVVIDKITGLVGLMMFGLFGLLFTRAELPGALAGIMLAFIAGAFVVLLSMRVEKVRGGFLSLIESLRKRTHKLEKFCDSAAGVVMTWREYLHKPGLLAKSTAYGLLLDAVLILQYMMVCRQYGIPASIIDLCWILPMVNVVQALPISLAGIGIRDVSMVAMFAYVGVSADSAMILAIVLLMIIIFQALCGLACILWDIARR